MSQPLYGIPILLPEKKVPGCCCRMPKAARVVAIVESVLIGLAVVGIVFMFAGGVTTPGNLVRGLVALGATIVNLVCVVFLFKAVRLRSAAHTLPFIIWKSLQTAFLIIALIFVAIALQSIRHYPQPETDTSTTPIPHDELTSGYRYIKRNFGDMWKGNREKRIIATQRELEGKGYRGRFHWDRNEEVHVVKKEDSHKPTPDPYDLQHSSVQVFFALYFAIEAGYLILQIVFIYIVVQVRHHLLLHPAPPMMYPVGSAAPENNLSINHGGYCNSSMTGDRDKILENEPSFQVATYEFETPPPTYDAAFQQK